MNESNRTRKLGITLVEMLVSISILSILMLAFTQLFGNSLKAASQINGLNELINEGQVAQQLIATRLQSAVYVYPSGTTVQMTPSDVTTNNTVGPSTGQIWKVGSDPILAMVLPPTKIRDGSGNAVTCGTANETTRNACFTFYAYYPYKRGELVSSTSTGKPPANPVNDNQWVLMEYKRSLFDSVTRSSFSTSPPTSPTVSAWTYTSILNSASSINMRGGSGNILVDYLQPATSAPTYTMFTVDMANSLNNVSINFRLLQVRGGKELRAPAATSSAPLSTRVYPRNWY